MSSLRVEADASSGGPYGEPSLLRSPELSAVRAVPMGASPSHPIFLALNELLLTKKLKIKKSTLERFLEECDMVAPWFAVSGSLTMASWEKLGHDLDFAAEQGTLRSGVRPIWKMVRGCLEDQRYGEAVENGQTALEMLQEERSEKAGSERIARKKEGGNKRMYPDLAELEDSDVSDDGSEYTEGVQSIIEQLESTNIQGKDGGKGIKGKGSARIGTFPASRRLPSAPPTYGTGGQVILSVRKHGGYLGPAGSRVGARCLVRRIPEDRKAEDVESMDDVRSAEPAVVDDIGPAVPLNGDRA
ncbi:hypothetical protein STEG23_001512 [Scotinomys teguina]